VRPRATACSRTTLLPARRYAEYAAMKPNDDSEHSAQSHRQQHHNT
jgi:hypothetical protein